MSNIIFKRNIEELKELASMFWPADISNKEAELSIIPKLLETQNQFIAILSVQAADIDAFFQIVNSSMLPANLFLKHLVVLADFGGEMLQRINNQFRSIVPDNTMKYIWNSKEQVYKFTSLPLTNSSTLSNDRLGISGKKLLTKQPLNPLHRDVIVLLLFGASSTDEELAHILQKCEISNYLGDPDKLEKFIRQRYIWVSRITGGSQSNNLGQIAQTFVKEYLEENLKGEGVTVKSNGHIPGISHTDSSSHKTTTFDLVVSKDNRYVAVEVSFQVPIFRTL